MPELPVETRIADGARDRAPAAEDESVLAKIQREVYVLGAGTVEGIGTAASAAAERPGETALKAAGAAAVGVGLVVLQRQAGLLRLGAQVAGLSMGVAFAADVASRMRQVGEAAGDTWNSANHLERNKAIVGGSLGAFAFDSALFMASGAAGIGAYAGARRLPSLLRGSMEVPAITGRSTRQTGAAAGETVPLSRSHDDWQGMPREVPVPGLTAGLSTEAGQTLSVPYNSPLARIYRTAQASVGKVEVLAGGNPSFRGEVGTAFAISADGKLATALHVVDDAMSVSVLDGKGRFHPARVIGADAYRDLAILQLERASSFSAFEPLRLAQAEAGGTVSGPVFGAGFPNGWNKLHASPGVRIAAPHLKPEQMKFEMAAEHGNSGGPIFDADGNVIAVLTSAPRNDVSTVLGSSSRALSALLERTKAGQAKGMGESGRLLPDAPARIAGPHETASYQIPDRYLAMENIRRMFGDEFLSNRPLDAFHSKVTRIDFQDARGATSQLALRIQYHPAEREFSVRPMALDGKMIADDTLWPASTAPINSAELRLKLDADLMPSSMTSINDALSLLPRAFNYRGQIGYLSGLKPDARAH